jgi:DNA-damage-inducible protein D
MESSLIPFEGIDIRKIWHEEQWYFSVVDVIEVLTDSVEPRNYWATLKKREFQLLTVCQQLKMKATDGRQRLTDCTNTEGIFRIIMSVPSPKAEPLKMWLAEQGKRTLDETETPELLTQRQIELYKLKGHSDEWIKERMQSIETRKRLTDEWQKRDVKEGKEYSILTAIIAKGTFGLNPSEHKKFKGLEKPSHELRDHMTPMELILTAFSEEATRQIAMRDDAKGFNENQDAAQLGGKIGGNARKNFEKTTGLNVVSSENYLPKSKEKDTLHEGDITK